MVKMVGSKMVFGFGKQNEKKLDYVAGQVSQGKSFERACAHVGFKPGPLIMALVNERLGND